MQSCPHCGSTDLVYANEGYVTCGNQNCAVVIEEKAMVADYGGGMGAAAGRIVFAGFDRNSALGPSYAERSSQHGLNELHKIVERMTLKSQIREVGSRMYELAVEMGFNQGRPIRLIAAAALYITCRRTVPPEPYLLIDFADAIPRRRTGWNERTGQVDIVESQVKQLGKCYMKLVRRMIGADPGYNARIPGNNAQKIDQVPIVDPSIFIDRYANMMERSGHLPPAILRKVKTTATKLIQYMHRDWICMGRRPNGLCGAALLIACYYHGHSCNAKDIAEIIRMKEGTLQIRLDEMRKTPLAQMNREEFETSDPAARALEDQAQVKPPCFTAGILRDEMKAATAALQDAPCNVALTDVERLPLQDAQAKDRSLMPPPATPVKGGKTKRGRRLALEDSPHAEDLVSNTSSASSSGATGSSQRAKLERYTMRKPTPEVIEAIAKDMVSEHHIQGILEGGANSDEAASRMEKIVAGKPEFDGRPLALASKDTLPESSTPSKDTGGGDTNSQVSEDHEETLSDVDEEELDGYLLGEEEQQHKSDIWHEVNKDYLEEWHVRAMDAKRRKQQNGASQSDNADAVSQSGSTRSSNRSSRRRLGPASSCTQSAITALSKKVSSSRINVAALDSLFED